MKKKIMRLSFVLCTALLFITEVRAAYLDDMTAARANATNIASSSSVQVNKKIPKEYSEFALGKNKSYAHTYTGVQEVSQTVRDSWEDGRGAWSANMLDDLDNDGERDDMRGEPSLAVNSIKNSYSILFKKVDVYNDTLVDVKETVVDFEVDPNPNGDRPVIMLQNTSFGATVLGVRWVKLKYEFFESGTNKPINVKGNTSYYDVDGYQGIVLNSGNKGIYVTSDCVLKLTKVDNQPYIFSEEGYDSSNSPTHGFSETFEGSTITRTFQFDVDSTHGLSEGFMGHSATPVAPVEPSKPVKKVSKSSVNIGEEYTYTVSHTVPQMLSQFYYKSFVIEDTLENVLSVNANNVSITNEDSEIVTSKFNITVSGQKISISPKNIADASFYGHTYNIKIKTSVKSGSDLTKYKQGDEYIIPNYATSKIADHENTMHEQKTEIVNVKVVRIKVNYVIVGNVRPDSSKTDKTPGTDIIDKGTKYNAASQLKTNDTTKSYTFKGWYTDEALTKKYVDGTVLNQDTTLYGAWEATVIVNVPPTAAQTPLIIAGLGLLLIAGGTTYYILNNKKSNK